MQTSTERVVIVGGGFGGLHAARRLARAPVDVTLIDVHNHHLFQPLLYQVASGALSPANIAAPLRGLLKRQLNARVLLARVVDIDVAGRRVVLADGGLHQGSVDYDVLIVAAGSRHSYFGHDDWEKFAPGLKTIDDATAIRRRILEAFEFAERSGDASDTAAWLSFIVVGAGPTGVELVGQIAEIAHHTLRGEFRSIDPQRAQVHLIEAGDRVLAAYDPALSERAQRSLERMGVTVLLGSQVVAVDRDGIMVKQGSGTRRIASRAVFWAAGIQASPLARRLAEQTGAEIDRSGRITVEPDLTIRAHSDIFVIGDMAHCTGDDGKPLPALAPVAMQQGRFVADEIAARRANAGQAQPSARKFTYHDRGTMATIGRGRAVAQLPWLKISGPLAWLAWLFVHLMTLVQFQNRVLVLVQWAWAYVTRNRAARLITGDRPLADVEPAAQALESTNIHRTTESN
ncbi:MAG TPA: NAD(P)/FAD-dependent oxidoreductase [Pirellulales bacterium]|nr:NAD(P)/FAD-dependent oxidoreductase [Pirellulales bacterium]